jgi:hypothetical protein
MIYASTLNTMPILLLLKTVYVLTCLILVLSVFRQATIPPLPIVVLAMMHINLIVLVGIMLIMLTLQIFFVMVSVARVTRYKLRGVVQHLLHLLALREITRSSTAAAA